MEYRSIGALGSTSPLLLHPITPKHSQPKLSQSPLTHNNGHYAQASLLRCSQNYQLTP
jgi:hypothetical protein